MAAKSKHWADVNFWIQEVIKSCRTQGQLQSTRKLVSNFSQYQHVPEQIHLRLITLLRSEIDYKLYEIVEKHQV